MLTPEEKDLILKVCYSSLLYGIIVYVEHDTFYDEREPYKAKISIKSHQILDDFGNSPLSSKFLVRPYLRSMSTMTEEEKNELRLEHEKDEKLYLEAINKSKQGDNSMRGKVVTHYAADWCIKKHFDIYGLIEKGLALEATKGMYK